MPGALAPRLHALRICEAERWFCDEKGQPLNVRRIRGRITKAIPEAATDLGAAQITIPIAGLRKSSIFPASARLSGYRAFSVQLPNAPPARAVREPTVLPVSQELEPPANPRRFTHSVLLKVLPPLPMPFPRRGVLHIQSYLHFRRSVDS